MDPGLRGGFQPPLAAGLDYVGLSGQDLDTLLLHVTLDCSRPSPSAAVKILNFGVIAEQDRFETPVCQTLGFVSTLDWIASPEEDCSLTSPARRWRLSAACSIRAKFLDIRHRFDGAYRCASRFARS